MTFGTEVHEQIFWSGGQSDVKPPVFSSKQAWYYFTEPLKGRKAESTLSGPGFKPRTCGVELVMIRLAYHKLEPCATEDLPCRGGRCTLNLSKIKRPSLGALWRKTEFLYSESKIPESIFTKRSSAEFGGRGHKISGLKKVEPKFNLLFYPITAVIDRTPEDPLSVNLLNCTVFYFSLDHSVKEMLYTIA
ncbi:hypothetical protein TNCV_3634371 [Trichonephila clavipes]|nr:hypothetical protein TNCV_3634371 [Trichonephila clavipes]